MCSHYHKKRLELMIPRYEGEIFQLDWELRTFQQRFSLCLEPRKHPLCLTTKPEEGETRTVLWPCIRKSRLTTHRSTYEVEGSFRMLVRWSTTLNRMVPTGARYRILDCGYVAAIDTMPHDEVELFSLLGEFNLKARTTEHGWRYMNLKNNKYRWT